MVIGMIILFASLFMFLFGRQYWIFAVARILQGFSAGCTTTLGLSLIADTFSGDELGIQVFRQ